MSLLFLCLTLGLLGLNFLGAGLLGWLVLRDYAVARIGSVLVLVLGFFFVEHFIGLGATPPLLAVSTAWSAWLIWRYRTVLHENWPVEAWFAAGFFYCLLWRWTFPDLDIESERLGNLGFITGYLRGETLPPLDCWLPPYRGNFYYSFQHYGAALLGRWLGTGPGMTYQLAYCTIGGLVTGAAGMCVTRLCDWKTGRALAVCALILGGSGAAVAAHAILKMPPNLFDCVRFLGGATAHGDRNALGLQVSAWMTIPGVEPRDLPMEPFSYVLTHGDYHPPLSGYVLLSFAGLLIASLEAGATGRSRKWMHALLAGSVPVALISNTWIFPLQAALVAGWFLYRAWRGERAHWLPAFLGLGVALLLEYPYLNGFMHQTAGNSAAVRWTPVTDRTPLLGWLLVFWPVVGILLLGFWNRERRGFSLFWIVLWAGLLFGTEFFFNDDLYADTYNRFNTTMKWWPWVFFGIVLTSGALNLGARSRWCRWGTATLLLLCCVFGYDLARHFALNSKPALGKLRGAAWLETDPVIKDLLTILAARPDGVVLESGLNLGNTEAPAIAMFTRKPAFLGWPEHESTWRGPIPAVMLRLREIDAFYAGTLPDPLGWLLRNNIRYVLWMPRDNADQNARFAPLQAQIQSHYAWQEIFAGPDHLEVGFWELREAPQASIER